MKKMVNVLVVDDSGFMRNMVKKLIEGAGGTVIGEAENGEEAVSKYDELKPDLVFMDIMMPKVTGLEALKQIMEKDKQARIVMCTSVGQEKVINEAVEAGAADFITKPFSDEDVKTVVSKYSG